MSSEGQKTVKTTYRFLGAASGFFMAEQYASLKTLPSGGYHVMGLTLQVGL